MAEIHFVVAKVFLAYVFIASIICCSEIQLDSAKGGDESADPDAVTSCRNIHGVPLKCAKSCTHCGFLKCTGGDYAGCLQMKPWITPRVACSTDAICQREGLGTLRHGAHVCQICATNNCNTGKDGDGGWYPY